MLILTRMPQNLLLCKEIKHDKTIKFLQQTFPKSAVEMIHTTLLFSVKTLQYLLFTAIGFTFKLCTKMQSATWKGKPKIRNTIKVVNKLNLPYTSIQVYLQTFQLFQKLESENDDSPAKIGHFV